METLIYAAIILSSFVSVPAEIPAPSNPNEPLIVRSYTGATGLEVKLANLEQEVTKISLTNLDQDKLYFSDVVRKHNGYSWNINLDQLPEGRYLLSVDKGDTLRRQVLLKTATGLMCSDWK